MEFAEIPKDVLPGLSVLTVTGNVEAYAGELPWDSGIYRRTCPGAGKRRSVKSYRRASDDLLLYE